MFTVFCNEKTSYEMCIRDWSSDVCSSNLVGCGKNADGDAVQFGIPALAATSDHQQSAGHARWHRTRRRYRADCAEDTGAEQPHQSADHGDRPRPEERRGGKECDITCRSGGAWYNDEQNLYIIEYVQ